MENHEVSSVGRHLKEEIKHCCNLFVEIFVSAAVTKEDGIFDI